MVAEKDIPHRINPNDIPQDPSRETELNFFQRIVDTRKAYLLPVDKRGYYPVSEDLIIAATAQIEEHPLIGYLQSLNLFSQDDWTFSGIELFFRQEKKEEKVPDFVHLLQEEAVFNFTQLPKEVKDKIGINAFADVIEEADEEFFSPESNATREDLQNFLVRRGKRPQTSSGSRTI